MDLAAHLLQPFLVADAEMLFLVNDKKAEVAELDRLRQHRVGADDDVHRALGQALTGQGRVLGSDKARQRAHGDGGAAEAFGEGLEVLAREQRGRGDHRDLHARHGSGEGRAHRHLGLAEAHVADDEPVHRAAFGEVGHDLRDRGKLVVGFLVGEAGAERIPVVVRCLEDRGRPQGAFGRDPHEPVGDLADAFLEPRLARLPGAAAQLVQKPLFMAETAEKLDVFDRQVKAVATRVFQRDAFMRRA